MKLIQKNPDWDSYSKKKKALGWFSLGCGLISMGIQLNDLRKAIALNRELDKRQAELEFDTESYGDHLDTLFSDITATFREDLVKAMDPLTKLYSVPTEGDMA